jgi:hypothetical protein
MPLKKVISGGQTGVDQAALQAAKDVGLETGGTISKGFLTLEGPRPDLAELYGLKEHHSPDYPPRTFQNVRDSDATIRIARNFISAGELCTLKAITQYAKNHLDIPIVNLIPVAEVYNWLESLGVETLNVAGNSETTSPGIYKIAYKWLHELFTLATSKKGEVELTPVQGIQSLPPEKSVLEVAPVLQENVVPVHPTMPPAGPEMPETSKSEEDPKESDKQQKSTKTRKKGKETEDKRE